MATIGIQLKNFKSRFFALRNNLFIFLYLGLMVVLAYEFFAIRNAAKSIVDAAKHQEPNHVSRQVRVSFEDYQANLKRLESNQNFKADITIVKNPFYGK